MRLAVVGIGLTRTRCGSSRRVCEVIGKVRRYGISRSLLTIWRRDYRAGAFGTLETCGGFVPLVVQDLTTTWPEAALRPAPAETIEITLTNGRRMTIPVLLAPSHLAALLAVLDP